MCFDPERLYSYPRNTFTPNVALQSITVPIIFASAGVPLYTWARMALSHKGMKISESDWMTFIRQLNATSETFQVPQRERSEVLNFVEGTKGRIFEG